MMKDGKDVVHRAATPSIFPYLLSGRTGKILRLGFSQERTLPWKWWVQTRCEIDGLQQIMTTSYTTCPQAIATRRPRPWLPYTGVMEHCSRRIFLGVDRTRYAGCSTIFCSPFLSGQRKRLVSFSFDFCTNATAWFWFRLLRVHPTLPGWKVLLRQASSSSNSNFFYIFLIYFFTEDHTVYRV